MFICISIQKIETGMIYDQLLGFKHGVLLYFKIIQT